MISLIKLFKRQASPSSLPPGTSLAEPSAPAPVERGNDDLSSSLVQGFQILLEGMPLDMDEPAEAGGETKRASLLRRFRGDLQPFGILEIATDVLTALEEDHRARQSRNEINAKTALADRAQAELAGPALQGLRGLILKLPASGSEANAAGNRSLAELARRLEGTVEPRDVEAVSDDAVAFLEQGAEARLRESREHHASLGSAEQDTELATASSKAMQMLLGAMTASNSMGGRPGTHAAETIPGLARQLASPQSPLDVLAIAKQALDALEQDAKAARDQFTLQEGQDRLGAETLEMTEALRDGFTTLLSGLPMAGTAAGAPGMSSRRALDGLLKRLQQSTSAAQVRELTNEALATLKRNAVAAASSQSDRQPAAPGDESLRALQLLLSELPQVNADAGQPDTALSQAIGELLHRLEAPLQPLEISAVVEDTIGALKRDSRAARERDRQLLRPPEDLDKSGDSAKALLRALQMLLGNWPAEGSAGVERKRVMDGLLHRLAEPLSPFDILDIATQALAALEHEAETTAKLHQQTIRESGVRQDDLLDAYMAAFRTLILGIAVRDEADAELLPQNHRNMSKVLRRLGAPLPPPAVLEVSTEAIKALRDNIRSMLQHFSATVEERGNIIALLANTLATLAPGKASSIARLRQLQQHISAPSSSSEELRRLTSVMADCLQSVIQREPAPPGRPAPAVVAAGPLEAAGDAFAEIEGETAPAPEPQPEPAEYAAVFVLDRENGIAKRFGEGARQNVLRFVQAHLKQGLVPTDRVVRWKGAAFVASVKRLGTLPDVRAELNSLALIGTPPVVEVDTRSISLPITLSWAVFPQAQFASIELLFKHVDQFIARTRSPGTDQ